MTKTNRALAQWRQGDADRGRRNRPTIRGGRRDSHAEHGSDTNRIAAMAVAR